MNFKVFLLARCLSVLVSVSSVTSQMHQGCLRDTRTQGSVIIHTYRQCMRIARASSTKEKMEVPSIGYV